MRRIILTGLMLLAVNSRGVEVLARDGDKAFWRVDTRRPPHELPPGTAADAVNKRFEDGRAWPRLCVQRQPWGLVHGAVNMAAGLTMTYNPGTELSDITITGFVVGDVYYYRKGTAPFEQLCTTPEGAVIISPGYFTATQTSYVLRCVSDVPVDANCEIYGPAGNTCGYKRFNDPNGFDVGVLLTDDWRDGATEDGGRGRAWLIKSGNAPREIPLNGHDIYGTCRLVPCFNAMMLLRQDAERHYFAAAAVGTDKITLNAIPDWNDGDLVFLWADVSEGSNFTGTTPPVMNAQYYVKAAGGKDVELYTDDALTNKMTWTGATGRFYLERQEVNPGFYGNGAPPLLAQGNALGNTWNEVGFDSVPAQVEVTAYDGTSKVLTAPNHRFLPGDEVYYNGTGSKLYVCPLGDHELYLYTTQTAALLNSGTHATISWTTGDYLVKTGASAQPMPPCREGYYTENNRFVGVNGRCNLVISDANDPLHYTIMTAELTANRGEADDAVAVGSIGSSDALVILKRRSILALYNFSGGPSQWVLRPVTRDYGCEAAQTLVQWGPHLMFLSRRGWDRVAETAFGVIQPAMRPVSFDLKKYTDRIDWQHASGAAAATWNNRLFLAVPLKGESTGSSQNNAVLVLNFLNSKPHEDDFAWEGKWSGSALKVCDWARLDVYGEERLTFCDYNGAVMWLGDGWRDAGLTAIADKLVTRAYFGGELVLALRGEVNWDHIGANVTVKVQAAGVNRLETILSKTYDRTAYQVAGAGTYNPSAPTSTTYNAAHRADYTPGPAELLAGPADQMQNTTEPLRMRIRGGGLQLVIENAAGACKVNSVEVAAKATEVRVTTA